MEKFYPKVAIFDLDGVITETAELHYEAWKKLGQKLNVDLDIKYMDEFRGMSREKCLNKILKIGNLEKQFNESEKNDLADRKNSYYIELLSNTNKIKVFPEIIELIKELRNKGCKISLASVSKNAILILKKTNIINLFDFIADTAEIKRSKPFPDIFLESSKYFKVKTSECWGFEDAKIGIEAINNAHMFSIGIGNIEQAGEANVVFKDHNEILFETILDEYYKYINKPILKLENINKIYQNNVQSIFDLNLEIRKNEFVTLIGPSGCGKSTTLRMIAGLEEITSGKLFIDNYLSNHTPSKSRNIAMVFQNYALYPHMTVEENISFGLKIKKTPRNIINEKIKWAAKVLDLQDLLNRKPKELSGGQRQRVALGRAIVRDVKLFLMDEPLANLDAKLRQKMRKEIKKLHERLGVNTIYVTHDQVEAMTMSDKIVVMNEGFIQQIGTPSEIYNRPSNLFVAQFIGDSEINLIDTKLTNGILNFNNIDILNLFPSIYEKIKNYEGKNIFFGFRPEDLSVNPLSTIAETHSETKFEVEIDFLEHLGNKIIIHAIDNYENKIKIETDKYLYNKVGEKIFVWINLNRIYFFEQTNGFNISIINNTETLEALKKIKLNRENYLNNKLLIAYKKKPSSRLTKKISILLSNFIKLLKGKKTNDIEADKWRGEINNIISEIKEINREEINNEL